MDLFSLLKQYKIVAIMRGIPLEKADQTAASLLSGGIRFIEVTMNTEGALDIVSKWREKFDQEAYIGAGTVLDIEMAKEAVNAGAQYIISPNLDEQVIQYGLEHGVEVWPGTMTPSEIVKAWKAGASAVKIFPMQSMGTTYLRELQGPLSHIPMIAVGGINLKNMDQFFKAGAMAVGIGSSLLNQQFIKDNQFDSITETAKQYVQMVSRLS